MRLRYLFAFLFLVSSANLCAAVVVTHNFHNVYFDQGPFSEGDFILIRDRIYEYYDSGELSGSNTIMQVTLRDVERDTRLTFNLSAVSSPTSFRYRTNSSNMPGCTGLEVVIEPDSDPADSDVYLGYFTRGDFPDNVPILYDGGDIYLNVTNRTMMFGLAKEQLSEEDRYLATLKQIYLDRGPYSEGDMMMIDGLFYEFDDSGELDTDSTVMAVTLRNVINNSMHKVNLDAVYGSSDFSSTLYGYEIQFSPDTDENDTDVFNGTFNGIPLLYDGGDLYVQVPAWDGGVLYDVDADVLGRDNCRCWATSRGWSTNRRRRL